MRKVALKQGCIHVFSLIANMEIGSFFQPSDTSHGSISRNSGSMVTGNLGCYGYSSKHTDSTYTSHCLIRFWHKTYITFRKCCWNLKYKDYFPNITQSQTKNNIELSLIIETLKFVFSHGNWRTSSCFIFMYSCLLTYPPTPTSSRCRLYFCILCQSPFLVLILLSTAILLISCEAKSIHLLLHCRDCGA